MDILTDQSIKEYKKPRKVDPARVNWNMYKELVANGFNKNAAKIELLSNVPHLQHLNEAVQVLSYSLYNAASVSTMQQDLLVTAPVPKNDILTLASEALTNYQEGNSDILAWQNIRLQPVEYLHNTVTEKERKN